MNKTIPNLQKDKVIRHDNAKVGSRKKSCIENKPASR